MRGADSGEDLSPILGNLSLELDGQPTSVRVNNPEDHQTQSQEEEGDAESSEEDRSLPRLGDADDLSMLVVAQQPDFS